VEFVVRGLGVQIVVSHYSAMRLLAIKPAAFVDGKRGY